jgi:hypothetical protein
MPIDFTLTSYQRRLQRMDREFGFRASRSLRTGREPIRRRFPACA